MDETRLEDHAIENIGIKHRLGSLLSSAGQMIWEIDRDFRVVFANELLTRVFGDPVGRTCHAFMSGSKDVCPDCPVKKIFEGAARVSGERLRYDKDGRPIWLQHTATPIYNKAGELIGATELIIDITQRKQTEEWLKDSERLYRNLVEQVPDIIFSLDTAGRFTFVNTQAERFLGRTVQRLLETPLGDYVDQLDRYRLESIFTLGPNDIWDEEIAVMDSEENRRYARIRCKASFNRDGTPIGFEGVMRDRTVRRKLEEDLRSSKEALVDKIKIIDELYEHIVQSGKCKAIAEHTAETAHELRQPLAIVGGFARRLDRQLDLPAPPDTDKQKQYLGIIISEIERLEKILDRLVDFTKRDLITRYGVNPNDLIEYILGIAQGRIIEKQIHFNVNLGAEIGDVPLDPGRFQQLVLNLVSNAIEATPVGGLIELETGVSIPSDKALKTGEFRSEGFFEMKIRNDGPEIPAEAIQKVFNPFYTTKQTGTGLGLAVSKKIVEDHTGTISVKSDGGGTVFTVWLPLSDPNAGSQNGEAVCEYLSMTRQ
jgi:PAS domain S-box-containing protein